MNWQTRVFQNFRLYAVTHFEKKADVSFLRVAEAVYRGGADILQLRAKNFSAAERLRLGWAVRKIATRMRKLYFVNDSLELALLTNADGLHVGQDDLPPKQVRRLCRRYQKKIFLGLSTHSEKQARAALKEPVDYFAVGPVFATPTKPDYESVGLGLVQKVSRFANKPWLAIGGIDQTNLNQVMNRGASRIAVVRAIFNASNPEEASRYFCGQLKG